MDEVVHFLSGLRYGGKEQVALRLAQRDIDSGCATRLIFYDTPFRSPRDDIAPGNVPWSFLPRPARFAPLYARRLARSLSGDGVTIIHAHGPPAIIYAALARFALPPGSFRRIHVVATFHITVDDLSARAALALRAVLPACARVAAVSEALATDLRSRLRAGVDVVANGVDSEIFRPRDDDPRRHEFRLRHGIPVDAFVVGALGRLDPVKRHEDLIAALEEMERRGAETYVVIGGDGPLREQLAARAARLRCVRLIGAVEDPLQFYAGLDVFALPSAYEAAPLVLLESLACGIPTVATAVGGIPGMIGGNQSVARLIPPGDPVALADVLLELRADPDLRRSLSKAGRARALEFSQERCWRRYRAWYDEIRINCGTSGGSGYGA